ncbi:MAG: 50S ribosomal protein L9 [Alphaproteobacteria bacterium]|nr:MAG: 50S ribosomal protein L9 [Alphaproteobacteria bacterium]
MQLILLERVRNLGFMGDIVTVKSGYGRNYLLPQGKALRASDANMKVFESRKSALEAKNIERRQEAEKFAAKMKSVTIILERNASELGQLYGSVTDRDVVDFLETQGFKLERRQIHLTAPIKQVSVSSVQIVLHPEVDFTLPISVAATLDEATKQLREPSKSAEEKKAEKDAQAAAEAAKWEASNSIDDIEDSSEEE